ncbi:hypothetical protein [Lyngbya aestuarii]|uniref:hypothetical protein n=1 Tax=Lyngbya aestuarii TaxID=118322 RepID=UPI00403DE797
MRNTIVLGSIRSGTSMLTATFRNTGAYFGDEIMPPTVANPYGYYECYKINKLNDRIIGSILHRYSRFPISILRRFQPRIHRDKRCSMLAAPRYIRPLNLPDEIISEVRHFMSTNPFCLKDPRFSLTLPFWEPVIPDGTRFLVVFRDPRRTVDSMLRNAKEIYNPPLPLDEKWGFTVWYRNYRRLLYKLSNEEDWLFIQDEQIFSGEAFPAIENFIETSIDTSQIKPGIRRSRPETIASSNQYYCKSQVLFNELKQRAKRDVEKWLK